ncbi:integral peroxisomal membrane peroxin-domain-containing protein [Lipomyces tetrasporus]
MNYAPRSFRELAALKDILYGGDDAMSSSSSSSSQDGSGNKESRKDHITDKLLERLFAAALPAADVANGGSTSSDVAERLQDQKNRPAFSVPVMARNFSRLNARIGVVFRLQYKIMRILTWRNANHTFSALAIYSFICLYPFLLVLFPVAVVMLGVMVPSFVQRHPPPPSPLPSFPVPSEGPPLAEARELRPVPELSRDFLMNMRDIQNFMDDFTHAYDRIVGALSRPTNFKDEQYSSAVYLALLVVGAVMFLLSPYLPWRHIFLVWGWIIVSMGHPKARRMLKSSHDMYVTPREQELSNLFDALVAKDIVLDEPPEHRHVEIFELQRQKNSDVDEWDDWLFSAAPYDVLSQQRASKQRPQGVRFLDEVLPPVGWKFARDSAWKLDLRPGEWVLQRSLVNAEIDSNSKWVYDTTSSGHKGEWRRRRWLRAVERQVTGEE